MEAGDGIPAREEWVNPPRVGSWGRKHKVGSDELSVDPGGSGTHAWFLSWGMPGISRVLGQRLLYRLSRSRGNETNPKRKSCTHGTPQSFGGLPFSLLVWLCVSNLPLPLSSLEPSLCLSEAMPLSDSRSCPLITVYLVPAPIHARVRLCRGLLNRHGGAPCSGCVGTDTAERQLEGEEGGRFGGRATSGWNPFLRSLASRSFAL